MPPTAIRRPPAPPPEPRTGRQRRKEARPAELVDAALALFVEKGFAATRTDEVAASAGVSKGTLYLYFPSKEDLLKAVIRQHLASPIAEASEFIDAWDGPIDGLLAALLKDWWTHIVQTPASGVLKLMMSEVRNFPELGQFYVQEVIEPGHRMLAAMVERGIAQGDLRRLPVMDVVHALIAPMLFMAMHKHSFAACPGCLEDLDHRSFIDTQIELLLRGLKARPQAVAPAPSPARPARRTTPR